MGVGGRVRFSKLPKHLSEASVEGKTTLGSSSSSASSSGCSRGKSLSQRKRESRFPANSFGGTPNTGEWGRKYASAVGVIRPICCCCCRLPAIDNCSCALLARALSSSQKSKQTNTNRFHGNNSLYFHPNHIRQQLVYGHQANRSAASPFQKTWTEKITRFPSWELHNCCYHHVSSHIHCP